MTSPTLFDWTTVAAIVLGPVSALGMQRLLDRFREKRNRRFQIYLTLMSLRSTPLHPDHVKALNALDTVFGGDNSKDRNVRKAWDRVLAHVNTTYPVGDEQAQAWNNTLVDLRVDLYQAVGKAVGYEHSVEYLKTHIYTPQYFGNLELDQIKIREGFAKILTADGLRVILAEPAAKPAAVPARRQEGASC